MKATYDRILRVVPRPIRPRIDESIRSLLGPRVGSGPETREQGGLRFEPWMYGAPAAVCISADFELAWASQYVSVQKALDEGRRTRRYFPTLLRTFNEFNIPVTWATVGHLFLDHCSREGVNRAHPELPRPPRYRNRYWSFESGDWYQNDPCMSLKESEEWYAPDLIDQIVQSGTAHEIGCHSFSHTDFSDAHCPNDVAVAELRRCQEEASLRGIRLKSFVFPGNFEGNFAALKETGFVAVRGAEGGDLCYPTKRNGVWNLKGSLQLFDHRVDYSVRLPRYLKLAVKNHACCHLSFHPSEPDPDTVGSVLIPILSILRSLRDQGDIWVGTMKDVASYCEARISARVARTDDWTWEVDWGADTDLFPRPALTFSLPWAGTPPTVEVDGRAEVEESKDCFVRDRRAYLTLRAPHTELRLRTSRTIVPPDPDNRRLIVK